MIWLFVGCGYTQDVPVQRAEAPQPPAEGVGHPEVDTAPPPPPETGFLYEGVLELTLTFSAAAVAGLATSWNQDVPDVSATLGYGRETWTVGVHLHGARGGFQPFEGKPGFKIDLDEFVHGGRFYGLEHLTLDNMVEDPSMLATHTSLALYTRLGHVAPRHGYVHLTVNGDDYGLYGLIETPDEPLVDEQYGGVGALYAGEADLALASEAGFRLVGGEPDAAALHALLTALDPAEPAELLGVLDAAFGADAFLDLLALELAIGAPDGFVATGRRYWLHLDPPSSRWELLPGRADRAFFEEPDVYGAGVERLYTACRADPTCSGRLDDRIAAVATTWEATDLVGWAAAEGARIWSYCNADPRSPWGPSGCDAGQGALLDYLRRRPAQLHAAVAR